MRAPRFLIALVVLIAACSFDWSAFDPRLDGGTTTAGGAAGGGAGGGMPAAGGGGQGGAGGGAGEAGTGGMGATGGAGGMGGALPPTLTDRGLLARYFIDEAASGTTPLVLTDAAVPPRDLTLEYHVDGGGVPAVSFSETGGHRGLTWHSVNTNGRAVTTVAGTKFLALDGATAVTLECVAHVVDASVTCSRLISVGGGGDPGLFSLCSSSPSRLALGFGNTVVEEWTVDLAALGRVPLTVVFDTTRAEPDDRVRLYVNGVDVGAGDLVNAPPAEGAAIAISTHFTVGNRGETPRSFVGTMFYSAVYTVALTDDEVENNAALLAASDDR